MLTDFFVALFFLFRRFKKSITKFSVNKLKLVFL